LSKPPEDRTIRKRLTFLWLIASTALAGIALAQSTVHTEPRYRGGFDPRACRYPKEARAASLSGCCRMNLEIDAGGRVLKIDGVCSDPVFLEPTRRCLSAQVFVPAMRGGKAVPAAHRMEYEWRATSPTQENLCKRLQMS
jgi:hypothetical protein